MVERRVSVGPDAHLPEQPVVRVPGTVDPGLNPRSTFRPLPEARAAPGRQGPQRHRLTVGADESEGRCMPIEAEVVQRGGRQARQSHNLLADRLCRGRRRGLGPELAKGPGDQSALPSLALPRGLQSAFTGYVAVKRDVTCGVPVWAANGRDHGLGLEQATVLAAVRQVPDVGEPARECGPHRLVDCRPLDPALEDTGVLAQHLVARVPGDPLERRVHILDPGVGVGDDDRVRRLLDGGP